MVGPRPSAVRRIPIVRDLELRLIDSPSPSGEIRLKDLAGVVAALQELSTRIGRDVVSNPGPGRTRQFVEEFAEIRLRGIDSGSTVLTFSRGPVGQLDVDLPEQQVAEARFWEIIQAISQDRRPERTTGLVAESAGRLVTALVAAAPRATLSDADHPAVEIRARNVRAETWIDTRTTAGTQAQARGRLEKVDLHSHTFRVRDDVGHAVDLKNVAHDVPAAQLVGQWVVATGEATMAGSRLVALDHVVITPLDDPANRLLGDRPMTLADLLASAPGPDPDGGIELTEEEFRAFLEAARG